VLAIPLNACWQTLGRGLNLLPPATEKVWDFFRNQPALAGFVLVGGSALSLMIQHRQSEDLDFIFPEVRLPREQLAALSRAASQAGFAFESNDDEASAQAFAQDGLELHDYQQDYLVNRIVKVSFFAPDEPARRLFPGPHVSQVRVANLTEVFKLKCLVSAVRSKTRDWLDLYVLLKHKNFTIFDYQQAFADAGITAQCGIGLTRLCSGVPQRDDEGYAHLLSDAPSLEQMKDFFVEQRNKLEIETAAKAVRRQV
jgi:hypothetical protein